MPASSPLQNKFTNDSKELEVVFTDVFFQQLFNTDPFHIQGVVRPAYLREFTDMDEITKKIFPENHDSL